MGNAETTALVMVRAGNAAIRKWGTQMKKN
jgi:hypothetical protein